MENWRTVLRNGFFPIMPTDGLLAVAEALRNDDRRLTQGSTTTPPPLMCVQDWDVEGTDFIGFVFWQSAVLPIKTVGEVEEAFAKACFEADELLKEAAACRFWLNYWDDNPRHDVFAEVLQEVTTELERRAANEKETNHES